MDDNVNRGYAFVAGDLWRAPFFPEKPEQQDSIFEALDTSITRLDLRKLEDVPHFTFDADLPELPALDGVESGIDSSESSLLPDLQESDRLDLWNEDDLCIEQPGTGLCTWEAFDGKDVANSQRTAFLSEAGPRAVDALLDPGRAEGVLPQDYTLRALCSLALGRSSTLFQWSEENRCFSAVLPGVPMSGTSQSCSASLIKLLLEMGTTTVLLREFGNLPYSSRRACPALVAMQNSVISVLDAIDQIICTGRGAATSILRLQHLLNRPSQLLRILNTLVASAKDCRTDESLISAISDHIHMLAQTGHEFASVFQAFLARVSMPWLERLSYNLGLDNSSAPMHIVGEITRETHSFLDDVDIEIIRETTVAIQLLREQDAAHPLLGVSSTAREPLVATFADPSSSFQQTSESAQKYEAEVIQQLRGERLMVTDRIPGAASPTQPDERTWQTETSQERYIAETEMLMSLDLDKEPQSSSDDLYILVALACRSDAVLSYDSCPDLTNDVGTPLDRVRPFLKTQNRLVNGILLRQLLRDHDLRGHLETQKLFQFFGSGEFVTRLSTALFSLEAQSAERKRGVVPTGEVMGLRLGSSAEQRWPPASSELRLTLAGVLEESQGTRNASSCAISFAIRELPEEEIERVLDANSVHALDFLRLQYAPTSPLDAVITPEAIQQYDVVFRFLLKLLRQLHVVKNLPRKEPHSRGAAVDEVIISFGEQSNHFVCTLMAHVMELGINALWRTLTSSIEQLEQAIKDEDTAGEIGTRATFGMQGLRQLHETCLDRIRSRLLLKRKYVKLRIAIEEVFSAILRSAAVLSVGGPTDMSAFEEQYAQFRQASLQLCEMLQQVVDRPLKTTSATEAEDADTIRALLLKLNWNGFYSSS